MNFEDFKQTVLDTRCTRRFDSSYTIPSSDLIELVDLARQTSSGKNMQPLKYAIINNNKIKDEIYKPLVWAAHLTDWDQKEDEKPSAYILLINDTSIEGFSAIDSGIAMQTIMLGAKAKGLAGCMMASIDKDSYKLLLNLEDHLEPMFIIALGKSAEQIKLVKPINNDTNYYREDKVHCVPKRTLNEVLIYDN
jgi:nitroreductase